MSRLGILVEVISIRLIFKIIEQDDDLHDTERTCCPKKTRNQTQALGLSNFRLQERGGSKVRKEHPVKWKKQKPREGILRRELKGPHK